MKKGIAIGMLAIASIILIGCQQKPAVPTEEAGQQKATTTATVKIEEGAVTTPVTGSLEILPAVTEEKVTGSLEIKPGPTGTVTNE